MEFNDEYIDNLSRTTAAQRMMLFRWFAGHGEATKVEAFKILGELDRQNRSQYDPQHRPEYFYSLLILALVKMHWIETAQSQKRRLTDEQIQKITDMRVARIIAKKKLKASPKKDLIRTQFFEEIRILRDKGLSWRQIAEYIHTNHRKKFTFGYLRDCYSQLAAEREGVGVKE